jgi:hypothetical protein
MSLRLSFHQPLLSPTGAHWLDDPPDLSCKASTPQHAVDGWPLSCNSVPTRERPLVPEADDRIFLGFLPAIVVGLADCLLQPHPGDDWIRPSS